jgi:hypothetical protein
VSTAGRAGATGARVVDEQAAKSSVPVVQVATSARVLRLTRRW